jgi:hypothetical protein
MILAIRLIVCDISDVQQTHKAKETGRRGGGELNTPQASLLASAAAIVPALAETLNFPIIVHPA